MTHVIVDHKMQHKSQHGFQVRKIVRIVTQEIYESYEHPSLLDKIEGLEKKVSRLEQGVTPIKIISDELAEEKIKAYLIAKKNEGHMKIDLIDIVNDVCLPVEQIEKIMEKLKSKGVKEIEE